MSENFNAFQKKFNVSDLKIARIGDWVLTLRPQQPTIGSLVLSLTRPCDRLSGLSEKDGAFLARAFQIIEEIYEKTFMPQKINYLGLMMVDHHAHFHIIPRYSEPVEINGTLFKDNNWPGPPGLEPLTLSNEELKVIYKILIETTHSLQEY
jgi:diadenosine tetraphosphate (Ap4A) HIT family hydrolase